jgi:thiosulfate dehydrogenase [quinone] large subunit
MQVVDRRHQLAVAVLRVAVGIIFLTAGLEKILGAENWTAAGFLQGGTAGTLGWPWFTGEPVEGQVFNPTHDFWVGLAANETAMTIIDFLVPYGQLAIGIGLILGLFTRFSAAMGTLMMLLFFVAAWDFQFGIVNQHLTYALVTFVLGYLGTGNFYGLDGVLAERVGRGWFRRYVMSGNPYPVYPEPGAEPASRPMPA